MTSLPLLSLPSPTSLPVTTPPVTSMFEQLDRALDTYTRSNPQQQLVRIHELVHQLAVDKPVLDIASFRTSDLALLLSNIRDVIVGNLIFASRFSGEMVLCVALKAMLDGMRYLDEGKLPYLLLSVHASKETKELSRAVVMIAERVDTQLVNHGDIIGHDIATLKVWCDRAARHPRALIAYETVVKAVSITAVDLDKFSPRVEFFTCGDKGLWGFSGVGTIYINMTKFVDLAEPASKGILKNLATRMLKVQLAAVTIHECAHVVLREAASDFNVSSPRFNNLVFQYKVKKPEIGFIVEQQVMQYAAHWFSTNNYSEQHFDAILDALENGNVIPSFHNFTPSLVAKQDLKSPSGFYRTCGSSVNF